jgi:hypothetical protein
MRAYRSILLALILTCALGAPAAAAESGPAVVMISLSFDSPRVALGGVATGHITLSDGHGAPAALDQDLTVQITCDFDGLVSVTQPQIIHAGSTTATFQILVLDLDLFGDPLIAVTADLGIYGADHATLRLTGVLN